MRLRLQKEKTMCLLSTVGKHWFYFSIEYRSASQKKWTNKMNVHLENYNRSHAEVKDPEAVDGERVLSIQVKQWCSWYQLQLHPMKVSDAVWIPENSQSIQGKLAAGNSGIQIRWWIPINLIKYRGIELVLVLQHHFVGDDDEYEKE